MRARIGIVGDLDSIIEGGVREIARDFRDAVDTASAGLQADLRQQTESALPRGRAIANAWRRKVYPENALTVTLHPAAVVWSRAPNVISAFDEGRVITARRGRFLCWPTSFNAVGGRRNAGSRGGVRVTIAEMKAAKGQTVVTGSKKDRSTKLWCLRVREASSTGGRSGRGKGRVRLFVGRRNVEVLTGRLKAGARAERAKELLTLGLVPMFYLKRSVNPGKRLDVQSAGDRAEAGLMAALGGAG